VGSGVVAGTGIEVDGIGTAVTEFVVPGVVTEVMASGSGLEGSGKSKPVARGRAPKLEAG
jgi:hypothetical protein